MFLDDNARRNFLDEYARRPTVRNGMGAVYVGLAKLAIRRPWLIPAMLAMAWAFGRTGGI